MTGAQNKPRGGGGRRKAPRRRSPAVKQAAAEASYVLELSEVSFLHPVNLRPAAGQQREQPRYLSTGVGNKHAVTRLWCDGVFVHIESERFQRRAVPLTNVLDVEAVPVRLPPKPQADEGDAAESPSHDPRQPPPDGAGSLFAQGA